ncbi:MAG: hypothetical protein FJ027_06405 [Candidatus Rokubacteria bacterium]|nr:hypothetical protein [Candidatus Rokubacteria bacterium]
MSTDPRQRNEAETGPLHEAAEAAPVRAAFPVDHSREAPAVTALHRRGFTAELVAEDGVLRVVGTDVRLRPEDVRIRDFYRFEGTSDPDDMSVIYAIEACDGTRGTLTDAYGAYADPKVGAFIDRVPVEPFPRAWRWRRALGAAALGAAAVTAAVVIARRRAA